MAEMVDLGCLCRFRLDISFCNHHMQCAFEGPRKQINGCNQESKMHCACFWQLLSVCLSVNFLEIIVLLGAFKHV